MKNGAGASLFAIALMPALAAVVGAQSPKKPVSSMPAKCFAIVIPTLEGVAGNASEAAVGVRDVMESYLNGPSLKVLALEAKLPSQAREEAKQKGCEPLLFLKLTRKTGGGKLLKAVGQAASTTSWQLPGGGTAASAAARVGAAGGLQAVSAMAQQTKVKDEVILEYRLESADGHVQFGPRSEHQTAKTDGEDILTPVTARAAENIAREERSHESVWTLIIAAGSLGGIVFCKPLRSPQWVGCIACAGSSRD